MVHPRHGSGFIFFIRLFLTHHAVYVALVWNCCGDIFGPEQAPTTPEKDLMSDALFQRIPIVTDESNSRFGNYRGVSCMAVVDRDLKE